MIDVKVELDSSGSWVDVTDRVTAQSLSPRRGRSPESSIVSPGELTLTLDNSDGALTDLALGTVARLSVRGPDEMGVVIDGVAAAVDGVPVSLGGLEPWRARMTGEVVEVAPVWPASNEELCDVEVTIAGLQRRLGQEGRTVGHAIDGLPVDDVVGWWPLTDPEGAVFMARVGEDAVGSASSGFQEGSLGVGLPASLRIGPEFSGSLQAALLDDLAGEWTVSFLIDVGGLRSTLEALEASTTAGDWTVEFGSNRVSLRRPGDGVPGVYVLLSDLPGGNPSASTTETIGPVLVEFGLADGDSWLRVTSLTFRQYVEDSASTSTATLQGVSASWSTGTDPGQAWLTRADIGQVVVSVEPVPNLADWLSGMVWERAGRRIERLCAEQGMAFEADGDLDATAPMGPQSPGNLFDVLAEAARTDGGLLDESRSQLGWRYVTSDALAGPDVPPFQWADMTLVVPADGSPLPVSDDLRWTTDVTVVSGDMSASASVDVLPRMVRDVEVSTPSAQWLQWLADRELTQGQERWRWPSVTLDLTLDPDDGTALGMWLDVNVGDRLSLGSMPSQSPVGTLDIVIEEISESITGDRWTATVSGAPSSAWLVAPPVVQVPAWRVAEPATAAPNVVTTILPASSPAVSANRGNRAANTSSLSFARNPATGIAVVFTGRAADHASGPDTPSGWTLAASQAQAGGGGARCFVRPVSADLPSSVSFSHFGSGYRSIVGMVVEPVDYSGLDTGDTWGWAVSSGQTSGTSITPTIAPPSSRPDYAWARSFVFLFADGVVDASGSNVRPAWAPGSFSAWYDQEAGVSTWREAGGTNYGGGPTGRFGWGWPPGEHPVMPTWHVPIARDWAWIHLLVWREQT